MRASCLMLAFVLLSSCIPAIAGPPPPEEKKLESLLQSRDKRLVTVLRLGQYYHRHDHLVVDGTRSVTPEFALRQGYSPCPECMPPRTTAILGQEESGSRVVSSYYTTYLSDRLNPVSGGGPLGASTAGTSQGGGGGFPGSFGTGLGSVGQGLRTVGAISGGYNQTMLR